MMLCEDSVREQLKQVIDPELFVNIVDLGLIYVVELKPSSGGEGKSEPQAACEEPASDAPADEELPSDALSGDDVSGDDVADSVEERDVDSGNEGSGVDVASSDGAIDVVIDMTMTSPACPAAPQLIANSKSVVSQMEGVGNVEIRIVMDPPWTPDRMTDDARDQLGIF